MKPSERIKELWEKDTEHIGDAKRDFAIMEYLDEQYEKNLTPEQRQNIQFAKSLNK